jgi:hypothetical protein
VRALRGPGRVRWCPGAGSRAGAHPAQCLVGHAPPARCRVVPGRARSSARGRAARAEERNLPESGPQAVSPLFWPRFCELRPRASSPPEKSPCRTLRMQRGTGRAAVQAARETVQNRARMGRPSESHGAATCATRARCQVDSTGPGLHQQIVLLKHYNSHQDEVLGFLRYDGESWS